MLGSDNDHILCSRLMIDVQNLMCRYNHWFLLRTYVVYFLINLVSAEMGEETVKTVILESVLKKRKREEDWALAKKQDLEATKKED